MPQILREFLSTLDDEEWKSELYKLLQNQSFNQVEVDLFELLCKVLDQNLFAQVDWARNSFYFKELEVGFSFTTIKIKKLDMLSSWIFQTTSSCSLSIHHQGRARPQNTHLKNAI